MGGGRIDRGRLPRPTPPAKSGTYVLVLEASRTRRIRIGALGTLELEPGFYAYVGSARGPGGLAARVAHHRRRARAPHWHIDYLRRHTRLREVWGIASPELWEHHFARAIAASGGASIPLPGFGASDCRCPAHLARFERRPTSAAFRRWLERLEIPRPVATLVASYQ